MPHIAVKGTFPAGATRVLITSKNISNIHNLLPDVSRAEPAVTLENDGDHLILIDVEPEYLKPVSTNGSQLYCGLLISPLIGPCCTYAPIVFRCHEGSSCSMSCFPF